MAKRKSANPMTPGTHWKQTPEGWVPRFVWKKLEVEGAVRPIKYLFPGEAFMVVMEFANAAGKAVFGVAPYVSKEIEGRDTFESNPAFDEMTTIKDILGGLKAPADIEIKGGGVEGEARTTPEGIPLDQIDPATLPQ